MFIRCLFLILLFTTCMQATFSNAYSDEILLKKLFFNEQKVVPKHAVIHKNEYFTLKGILSGSSNEEDEFFYTIKSVSELGDIIRFANGSSWQVEDCFYRDAVRFWNVGDKVRVYYGDYYDGEIEVEMECVDKGYIDAILLKAPDRFETIKDLSGNRVVLHSGHIFEMSSSIDTFELCGWRIEDPIMILSGDLTFDLWNIRLNKVLFGFTHKLKRVFNFEKVLELEDSLNFRVLNQKAASKTVVKSVINYVAGLQDPGAPIGVFLFLGPTGVGKTEFAKVLNDELYGSRSLLRFDMSHFSEKHSISKLIGSPPGYVAHDEGGQLTNSLGRNPNQIVLLDEMEKAHTEVQKAFLPIFDEGYLTDNKGNLVECKNTIYIMTSNLCSTEITQMFKNGASDDEILKVIEPKLINSLSPELYNRVEPIVFRPLTRATMVKLVDMMLEEVAVRLKDVKNLELSVDSGVKSYLVEKGYHPDLGARPLKKLIDKEVVSSLSYALITQHIPSGSHIILSYSAETDSWYVNW